MSKPHVYSAIQLGHYFDHVALPQSHRHTSVTSLAPTDQLAFLELLQAYHLCAVPFENLSLHYNPHHSNTLDPEELFQKIISVSPGNPSIANHRGGYCMETNCFFGTMLRSLGFDLYPTGGRVRLPAGYTGWSHMVNIVTIDNRRYMVDVGFGGNGPVVPLQLCERNANEEEEPVSNIAPAMVRVGRRNIGMIHTDRRQLSWVLEHSFDGEQWTEVYAFGDEEFSAADFEVMNYFTATNRGLFFTWQVLCIRMLMGEAGEIEGQVILVGDKLKVRRKGTTELRKKLNGEDDRIAVLSEWFGVYVSDVERRAISGTAAELLPGNYGDTIGGN